MKKFINIEMRGIKSLIRKALCLQCLEDLEIEQRREMWPLVLPLEERHIQNCRLVENRIKMLDLMPKQAVCAELGILQCDFSEEIMKHTYPTRLHLIDFDDTAIKIAEKRFAQQVSEGTVKTHRGDSSNTVMLMPDKYFDWVYIDANHDYENVKRDLEAVRLKLKRGGVIALNDYIFFAPSDFSKYGVVEAVNEFCIKYEFELIYFALQGRMYNDVAIRKLE